MRFIDTIRSRFSGWLRLYRRRWHGLRMQRCARELVRHTLKFNELPRAVLINYHADERGILKVLIWRDWT